MFAQFLMQATTDGQGIGYFASVIIPVVVSILYAVLQHQKASRTQTENNNLNSDYNQLDAEHQRAQAWLKEAITSSVHMVLANRDNNVDQAKFDTIADTASAKLIEIADKAHIPIDAIVDKVSALHGVDPGKTAPAQASPSSSNAPTTGSAPRLPTVTTSAPATSSPPQTGESGAGTFHFSGLPESLAYGQRVEVTINPVPKVGMLTLYESDGSKTPGALVEIDQTSPQFPNSLRFVVPASDSPYAKRWRPGYYLVMVSAKSDDGHAEQQSYLLKL